MKLSSSGVLDSTFGPDHSGKFCFNFAPPTDNPTGKFHYEGIVVATDDSFFLTSPSTDSNNGAIAHFHADGNLVTGFGTNGISTLPFFGVLLRFRPDDNLFALGILDSGMDNESDASALVTSNGNIDTMYGTDGLATFDPIHDGGIALLSAAFYSDNRAIVALSRSANGIDSPFCIARLDSNGMIDETFNASSQQSGYPGLASLLLSSDPNTDEVIGAAPLTDGHIFAAGTAGSVGDADGPSNLALVRLNDDASYDTSFGDAAHPGWAGLNLGGPSTATTTAKAFKVDAAGRAWIAVSIGATTSCAALVRVIPDRIFDDRFEQSSAFTGCSAPTQ